MLDQEHSPSLAEKLYCISQAEQSVTKLLFDHISKDGGRMYMSHLFMLGVGKRTVAQCSGFRVMIEQKNFICAAALLRMQIDTSLRVFASTLFDNPETYAEAVFSGKQVNKLKDRNSQQMNDSYLVRQLANRYPWIENVYKNTSGFVHFSERHIFASMHDLNENDRTVSIMVGPADPERPESDYYEIVDAFQAATDITMQLLNEWMNGKTGAPKNNSWETRQPQNRHERRTQSKSRRQK